MTKKEFKAVRHTLGLSQTEMADLMNVSRGHIQRTENTYSTSYNVSQKTKERLEEVISDMGTTLETIYKLAKREGYLK